MSAAVCVQGSAYSALPAMVLEGGIGGSDIGWFRIRALLAGHTRVLSHVREVPPGVFDAAAAALRLREKISGEIGRPFVLVGHSLGALYAQLFAAQFPDDVLGLVLVDAAPDDANIYPGSPGMLARRLLGIAVKVQLGLLRLFQFGARLGWRGDTAGRSRQLRELGLPQAEAGQLAALARDPDYLAAVAREIRATRTLQAQVRAAHAGGAISKQLPLLVVTAGKRERAGKWVTGYYQAVAANHAQAAARSLAGAHRTLADADHNSILTGAKQADELARLILEFARGLAGRSPP